MKKMLILILIGLVVIGSLAAGGGREEGARRPAVYSLATAPLGGTYYIVGAGISEILTREIPHLTVNAIISGGSTANPMMLHRNEAEIGITNYISASAARAGTAPFDTRVDIMGIAPLQFSSLHIMVMGNSGIYNLADMRGRRVNLGPAGSGGALFFRELLPFWGFRDDEFNWSFLSFVEGTEALRDGRVDVNVPNGAFPLETVASLAAFADMRLINLETANMQRMLREFPHYSISIIPAGTYRGINQDVQTGGNQDILIVQGSMDEEEAYLITKAIYEHMAELRRVHPSLSHMTFAGYNHGLVPLHPGALRFYRERGISIVE